MTNARLSKKDRDYSRARFYLTAYFEAEDHAPCGTGDYLSRPLVALAESILVVSRFPGESEAHAFGRMLIP